MLEPAPWSTYLPLPGAMARLGQELGNHLITVVAIVGLVPLMLARQVAGAGVLCRNTVRI